MLVQGPLIRWNKPQLLDRRARVARRWPCACDLCAQSEPYPRRIRLRHRGITQTIAQYKIQIVGITTLSCHSYRPSERTLSLKIYYIFCDSWDGSTLLSHCQANQWSASTFF